MSTVTAYNASFVMNTCMNNCSIVNLEITGNVSFQNLKILNSCVQNISLSYWSDNSKLNALNSCVQNISTSYWSDNARINSLNTCLQNVSSNFWALNACVQNISTVYWSDNARINSLNTCLQNVSSNFWSLNACVQNISTVCWSDNLRINSLNTCLQNVSSNFWALNACVQNISTVYWNDNARINSLNTCLQNVSSNFWVTSSAVTTMNSSIQNISNVISNISLLNLSTNFWKSNVSLQNVLSTYLTTQPLSISTVNASIRTLVCPAGSISVSTTNNGADKAIQVFNNNGTVFLSPGNGTTGNYNSTTIAGDNVLGYYGGSSVNTGTLNITQWGSTANGIRLNANTVTITDTLNVTSALNVASNAVATQTWVQGRNYLTTQPVSISTANACITNLSCTSIAIGSNAVATQSYVTTRGFITSTPGTALTMNSNNITFSNNGAGLVWGNNYSQIYDNGNLYITTDDYLNISAPTRINITSTDTYFSGNVYNYESLLASQNWVNLNFLTTSPSQLTVGKLIGNPIISYTNANCYIQALSATGNNWIQFRAFNTTTDAQILCTAGSYGTPNNGNLNFYCNEAVFNCGISSGYAGYNKLVASMPYSNDCHRWTFNCRGYDTFWSESYYNGVIKNTLNGTVNIPGTLNASNVTVNNDFICNSGIIVTSTSAPPNYNFIGFTGTMKITNSMSLPSGYTCLFTFSPPVAGYYSLQAQITYQWVVGTAQWNQLVYGLSTSITSFDAECYYGIFERNPRVSGNGGTDSLITNRVIYVQTTTPVYFIVMFSGGTGNFATASSAFTFLRYTRIA